VVVPIFVKALTGRTVTLDVEVSDAFGDVKVRHWPVRPGFHGCPRLAAYLPEG